MLACFFGSSNSNFVPLCRRASRHCGSSVHRRLLAGTASSIPRSQTSGAGISKSPVTQQLWEMRQRVAEASGEDSPTLASPGHLLTKVPAESAVQVSYSFTSDPELATKYENAWGYVRMGIVLEDLDALAGTVAFNHCCDNNPETRPLLIVTACVDQISMVRPLRMKHDHVITGQVSWVGRSSMEIRMEVAQAMTNDLVLVAHFTFVGTNTS